MFLQNVGLKFSVYNIFNDIGFIKSIAFVSYIVSRKINRVLDRFGYIAQFELDPFEWAEVSNIISCF
jgi:hypothetical protein